MLRRSFLTRTLAVSAGAALARGAAPLWAQAPAASVPPGAPAAGKYLYKATRGGSDIGTYRAEVVRNGDQVKVTSETAIAVKVVVVTAYRFEQRTSEAWQAGKPASFSAITNDDGDKTLLEGMANGSAFVLNVNGKSVNLPPTIVPASLWNPRLVQQSKLFDTGDGRLLNVNVKLVGEESLTIRGAAVKARRFAFTGDMQRDIWYDQSWTPVQATFLATKDKSEIKLVLA